MADVENKKYTIYVLGNGEFLELGNVSQTDYEDFVHLSQDAQKDFINKRLEVIPKEHRKHAGFCKEKSRHVTLKECLLCARGKNKTKKAEWEACKNTHLERY